MANLNVNRIHGFTIVELVVLVCVVGIIGASGYVWWKSEIGQATVQPTNLANQSVPSVNPSGFVDCGKLPVQEAEPVSSWLPYTAPDGFFSIMYPPGWLRYSVGVPLPDIANRDLGIVCKAASSNSKYIKVEINENAASDAAEFPGISDCIPLANTTLEECGVKQIHGTQFLYKRWKGSEDSIGQSTITTLYH